jgi:hypothetical protein
MRQSSNAVFIVIYVCYRIKIQSSKGLFHAVSLCLTTANRILKHSASLGFGGWGRVGLEEKRPFGIHIQRCEDFMEIRMVRCGLESVVGLCDHCNELFGFINVGNFFAR